MSRFGQWLHRGDEARAVDGLAARLARHVPGPSAPRIALHPPVDGAVLTALRCRFPQGVVVELPDDPVERHLTLTALGPVDLIVDPGPEDERLGRFLRTFYQLRPGATYVVLDGAAELGAAPGPLGSLLAAAAELPADVVLDAAQSVAANRSVAVRRHLDRRVAGPDLLLSHDLPGVLVKIREDVFNDYLDRADTAHRVIEVIEAEDPVGTRFREGPEALGKFHDLPITPFPLSLRDYRDVVVGLRQVVVSDRLILPDTYRHNQAKPLFHRSFVDIAGPFAVSRVPMGPEGLPRLDGTFVHLDNEVRGHFGHLLTESIARAWAWPRALELDPDARVLVAATSGRPDLLPYEIEIYEGCGIPRDRIVKIDRPHRVERLIVGTPMFSNPHYVHPRIAETWQTLGDRLASRTEPRPWPRRLFLSRRPTKRACLNKDELEAVFVQHGFEIRYPEDHTLGDQVRMFRAAEVIAGYAGSGMFQVAFVPRPTHVIQVGSDHYSPRNEYLMAAVHGHRLDRITCRAIEPDGQSDFVYDEAREGPFLRGILKRLGG